MENFEVVRMYVGGLIGVLANVVAYVVADLEEDHEYEDVEDVFGPKWVVVGVQLDDYIRMGDPCFKLHFRMNRATFESLLGVLAVAMEENGVMQRRRTPLELKVMHALWIFATPDSFRSVALRFGVRPGTVHQHYLQVMQALCDVSANYIKWPSQHERVGIQTAFQRYSGFPGIVGCVDGTYVVFTAPHVQPRRYINRHHQFSMNIQAVCDHTLLVRDLHAGEAGSLSDGRVFRRSPLCRRLLSDPTVLDENQHIIGDSAYMLTDKLLTPYRNNGHLVREQRRYNYILSRCRSRIEHCFGKIFSQWRRLKFLHVFDYEYAVQHTVATFVLHNFMIINGEEIEDRDEYADNEYEDNEEERQILDEIQEDAINRMPQNLIEANPILRQLRDAKVAGTQKRDNMVGFLNGEIDHLY